jgi:hypothetical protein
LGVWPASSALKYWLVKLPKGLPLAGDAQVLDQFGVGQRVGRQLHPGFLGPIVRRVHVAGVDRLEEVLDRVVLVLRLLRLDRLLFGDQRHRIAAGARHLGQLHRQGAAIELASLRRHRLGRGEIGRLHLRLHARSRVRDRGGGAGAHAWRGVRQRLHLCAARGDLLQHRLEAWRVTGASGCGWAWCRSRLGRGLRLDGLQVSGALRLGLGHTRRRAVGAADVVAIRIVDRALGVAGADGFVQLDAREVGLPLLGLHVIDRLHAPDRRVVANEFHHGYTWPERVGYDLSFFESSLERAEIEPSSWPAMSPLALHILP